MVLHEIRAAPSPIGSMAVNNVKNLSCALRIVDSKFTLNNDTYLLACRMIKFKDDTISFYGKSLD